MRYAGKVGYKIEKETVPGVWEASITERSMVGDVIGLGSSTRPNEKVNEDIQLNNQISIVADAFAYENFTNIKYITLLGQKWEVTGVRVNRPRLILTTGGLWNGD